jgi:DNA-binding beta-propeller fold protein YncE
MRKQVIPRDKRAHPTIWIAYALLLIHAPSLYAGTLYYSALEKLGLVEIDSTVSSLIAAGDDVGLPTDLDLDVTNSRLYWTDSTKNSIRTATTSGTDIQTIISTDGQPAGLALLWDRDQIVWSERHTNRIQIANLDGSNQQTLIADTLDPRSLDYDPVKGEIYWVEFGGKIRRAKLDGTGLTDIVSSGLTRPIYLSIDPLSRMLYWSELGDSIFNRNTGIISRSTLDGDQVEVVLSGLSQPSGLDVDPTNERLYYVSGLDSQILSSDLDGSSITEHEFGGGTPLHVVIDTPPVPEPTSLALLAVGVPMLFRRRVG